MFETKRLILRKFTLDDVTDAWEMNSDPLVTKYIIGEGAPTLENVRDLIKDRTLVDYEKYGYGRMAVVLKESGRFIGFSGLKFDEEFGEVDLGYRFKSEYWGQGFATEAGIPMLEYGFNELGLKRIVAAALPGNKGSIRVMEKLGMKFEKFMDIEGYQMVYYAIEKEE